MYADDLVSYHSSKNWLETKYLIERGLNEVFSWTAFNRLKVNFAKSKYQVIGPKSGLLNLSYESRLYLPHSTLERVYTYTYVGVIMDCNRRFEPAMPTISFPVCCLP